MARTDSFRDWGSAGNVVTADAAAATAAATRAAAAEPLESGVDGAVAWRGAGDGERLASVVSVDTFSSDLLLQNSRVKNGRLGGALFWATARRLRKTRLIAPRSLTAASPRDAQWWAR